MHTQCQHHFKQAHGSPYTVPPLSDLLGTNSLTEFGDALLQGTTNLDTLQVSPTPSYCYNIIATNTLSTKTQVSH